MDSTSIELTSDITTWSEFTETTALTSTSDKMKKIRHDIEPPLLIARKTVPFGSGIV